MKLLRSTKNETTKEGNGENVPRSEITLAVLVLCSIVNNDCQQNSRVLYTLVSNKSFGQLLRILPEHFTFLKTFISEFLFIKVWFTDQNSKPLEIEDKINLRIPKISIKKGKSDK